MKRIVLLITTILLLMCVLTSCIIIPKYKNFDISSDTVSSIEIYDLRNSKTHYSDFLETETPAYKIAEKTNNDFLSDLKNIEFSDTIIITVAAVDPSFTYDDWVARINYNDGSYELISCDGYGEKFNENDEVTESHHFSCDNDEWHTFIEKYVPEELFKEQDPVESSSQSSN